MWYDFEFSFSWATNPNGVFNAQIQTAALDKVNKNL